MFENGEDVLLGFQTTAAQTRALLSNKAKFALFNTRKNYGRGRGDLWVNDGSCAYDRTSGIHLMGGLAAAA